MWIAQDKDGAIAKFKDKPRTGSSFWDRSDDYTLLQTDLGKGQFIEGWENSLINLETHDYKIEDGILIKVEKEPKRIMGRELQVKNIYGEWRDCESHYEYRIKPKTKIVRFRNYLDDDGEPCIWDDEHSEPTYIMKWIGDWQEVEIEA